jgi:hypothetical protein
MPKYVCIEIRISIKAWISIPEFRCLKRVTAGAGRGAQYLDKLRSNRLNYSDIFFSKGEAG